MSEVGQIDNEKLMTLLEHLNEFKDRIVRIALAIIVWSAASFVLASTVLNWLLRPMQKYEGSYEVIATKPTTMIGLFMKISLFTGAVLAMPWIVHQVLLFILPGLTKREKRSLVWIIPGATFFFLTGVLFAYFVMIPTAIPFLLGFSDRYFGSGIVAQKWMIDEYLPFVTGLIFWVGVSFEMPLVMAFIARLGVVTARQMLQVWKFALVAIAILAAFITPTPDPFNMGLVMAPLVTLYFLGILLARLVQPRETTEQAAQEPVAAQG
ncbi:MAG: twin-arginine translocase subunit TatC [Anaerolineae bacterium]|nr:twin-arginine translocase subunit TatC [Anaerolineae bacterium]